jgi:5-methyltetrahydropteroyltriglutamate--homocysteine methyltransferase
MATAHHAEHVGSLLRPPYLLRAREAHETGELTTAQLREAEDRAIAELLEMQEQAGLTVFTDGEARRESWRAGLLESLSGVEPASRTLRWYRDGKELSRKRRSATARSRWPRCRENRTLPASRPASRSRSR